jgi:hypothetical protein
LIDEAALAVVAVISSTIDYRLKPLIERFGDHVIIEIRTADVEDFVADFKRPRAVNGCPGRTLAPASINRTLGLLRHMLNWAVGREYGQWRRMSSFSRRFRIQVWRAR